MSDFYLKDYCSVIGSPVGLRSTSGVGQGFPVKVIVTLFSRRKGVE